MYTGFSQGGSYVRRWTDEDGLKRYTVDPVEISLVDLPCLPEARFEMIKTDGSHEWREFGKNLDPIAQLSAIIDSLENLKSDAGHELLKEVEDPDLQTQLKSLLDCALGILRERVDLETLNDAGKESLEPAKLDHTATFATPPSTPAARNKAEDLTRPQTVDDTPAELGATSDTEKHAAGGIAKRLDAIAAKLDDLLQGVKNIESQPLPLPLAGKVRAVSKSEDGAPKAQKPAEPAPTDRDTLALLAIKKAQQNGRNYFGR